MVSESNYIYTGVGYEIIGDWNNVWGKNRSMHNSYCVVLYTGCCFRESLRTPTDTTYDQLCRRYRVYEWPDVEPHLWT